jgi:hypothetical protein
MRQVSHVFEIQNENKILARKSENKITDGTARCRRGDMEHKERGCATVH